MPLSSVEYLEVANPTPIAGGVIGTIIMTVDQAFGSGSAPSNSMTAMDTVTTESRLYSGFGWVNEGGASAHGGFLWANDSRLRKIHTGGLAENVGATSGRSWVVGVGDYVLTTGRSFLISTGVMTTGLSAIASPVGVSGGQLYCGASGPSIQQVNPATGATIGSPIPIPVSTSSHQSTNIGSTMWWAVNGTAGVAALGVNPDGTVSPVVPSPSGFTHSARQWTAHTDGYLYRTHTDMNRLQALDPATGRWALDDMVTSRGRRYCVFSVGGKLWVPSGEPLVR